MSVVSPPAPPAGDALCTVTGVKRGLQSLQESQENLTTRSCLSVSSALPGRVLTFKDYGASHAVPSPSLGTDGRSPASVTSKSSAGSIPGRLSFGGEDIARAVSPAYAPISVPATLSPLCGSADWLAMSADMLGEVNDNVFDEYEAEQEATRLPEAAPPVAAAPPAASAPPPPAPSVAPSTQTAEGEGEEDESLALARRLMEEESMSLYNHLQQAALQVALQYDGGDDDFAFAAQVMRDELAARVGTEMDAIQQAVGVAAEEEEAEGEEGDAPADGGVQFEGLSYDQLLELGDRMGDVARERWVRAAPAYIKTLKQYVQGPTPAANAHLPLAEGLNPLGDSADRCLVCQCEYECDEVLTVMPCQHLYHFDCISTWLSSNKTCPVCKCDVTTKAAEAPAAPASA